MSWQVVNYGWFQFHDRHQHNSNSFLNLNQRESYRRMWLEITFPDVSQSVLVAWRSQLTIYDPGLWSDSPGLIVLCNETVQAQVKKLLNSSCQWNKSFTIFLSPQTNYQGTFLVFLSNVLSCSPEWSRPTPRSPVFSLDQFSCFLLDIQIYLTAVYYPEII